MKKVIMSICFLFAVVTMVSAQQQRGAERMAEMKKALKEQVNLTDSQIDSVMAIDAEFRPRQREIRMDQAMSDADKAAKTKVINDEKKAKLETFLGKETADKIDAFYTAQRNRQRQGGQGNNGNAEKPADNK